MQLGNHLDILFMLLDAMSCSIREGIPYQRCLVCIPVFRLCVQEFDVILEIAARKKMMQYGGNHEQQNLSNL